MEEIKEKIAYRCNTRRAALEFLKLCAKSGIRWAGFGRVWGTEEEAAKYWDKKSPCFLIENKELTRDTVEYMRESGRTVKTFGAKKRVYFSDDEKKAVKVALRVLLELERETGEKAGNIPAAVIETILNKLDN